MNKLRIAITKYKGAFPCTGCGSCCKRIDQGYKNISTLFNKYGIPLEELDFPYGWDESGKCENLTEDNKCAVYLDRPNVCNIQWFTERVGLNKSLFYSDIIKVCNTIMDEDNVDQSFRIVE